MARSDTRRADVLDEVMTALQRMAILAEILTEAHALGVEPGPFDEPWQLEAQRHVVPIYAAVFPEWYQNGVAAWFERVANELVTTAAPTDVAEEWSLVEQYFRSVSLVIREQTGSGEDTGDFAPRPSPPPLLDYGALASKVSVDGVRRLVHAATTVRHELETITASPLTRSDSVLLTALAEGASVDDAAVQAGYSRRTAYRIMTRLQADVGVTSRSDLVAIAIKRGWIEPGIRSS